MNPFAYTSPKSTGEAASLATSKDHALPVLKTGGMDLLDRMKEGLENPGLVIDLTRIDDPALDRIETGRIGGRATTMPRLTACSARLRSQRSWPMRLTGEPSVRLRKVASSQRNSSTRLA